MSSKNHQTIDPLILETLNLNQKRIYRILDILHGRDSSFTNKSQFQEHSKKQTPSVRNYLPQITKNKQAKSLRNNSKSSDSRPASLAKQKTSTPYTIFQSSLPINKTKKKKSKQMKQNQTPPSYQSIKINRTEQLLKDYRPQIKVKLYKNKSQQINTKDVYRHQIQTIIAQLTDINDLQAAQNRMKKLKKRYQHLKKLDKGYYSKLNQVQFAQLI